MIRKLQQCLARALWRTRALMCIYTFLLSIGGLKRPGTMRWPTGRWGKALGGAGGARGARPWLGKLGTEGQEVVASAVGWLRHPELSKQAVTHCRPN